jgi:hypothetical protein
MVTTNKDLVFLAKMLVINLLIKWKLSCAIDQAGCDLRALNLQTLNLQGKKIIRVHGTEFILLGKKT